MAVELKVPEVGESITEVLIGEWFKQVGDSAQKDDNLVEIESDKATVELSAPVTGKIARVLKQRGETATVGEVIGYMDEVGAATTAPAPRAEPPRAAPVAPAPASPSAPVSAPPVHIMPAAARELAERGLNAADVSASGPGGRLLKEDVLAQPQNVSPAPVVAVAAPQAAPAVAPRAPAARPIVGSVASGDRPLRESKTVPMSPIRQRIAERLVEAQRTAALLTTFNEVDMSSVMALRQDHKDAFHERYGVKLGFMSFFVKSVVDALRQFPQLNAEVRGTDVVYYNYYDVGIAVSGGKGLVVPVLRNAERLNFAQIEAAITDFGVRARDNKIKLEELQGGTFTISNGGVFGSLLSTPIINPPQTGILGLHMIEERPVARDGAVVIRPMMYVALSYDHRIVDGREAVTFLRRLKECIENPSRLLLEI